MEKDKRLIEPGKSHYSTIYSDELTNALAKIGTGNITIDYNYVDGAKDNRLLDDCYFAGSIEVFSDGFISCDIFDEKYAQIIIKDFLEISGDTEVPNDIFWQSKTIDKNRWKKAHSFIKEHGIILQYSEDMQQQ